MAEGKKKMAQISFRIEPELKNRFMGKVKGQGLESKHVLREKVLEYLGEIAPADRGDVQALIEALRSDDYGDVLRATLAQYRLAHPAPHEDKTRQRRRG